VNLNDQVNAQADRLKNKKSRKTVFPDMAGMVDDFARIDRDLRDLKTIFTVICMEQDDLTLQVPLSALMELPKGIELEIGFDRTHNNYTFKAILPQGDSQLHGGSEHE
jgi:hypothetical protein